MQLGVILVYGVDRDGIPSGAERPFGDLCIRSFIMHAGLEYSEIIMSGGCSYEGKTYRAVASSKPGAYSCVRGVTQWYNGNSKCVVNH